MESSQMFSKVSEMSDISETLENIWLDSIVGDTRFYSMIHIIDYSKKKSYH